LFLKIDGKGGEMFCCRKIKNPYLKLNRLADVIAAITTLANYRYYKLSFESVAERISNKPNDADKWKGILSEHPEFFRVVNHGVKQKVSLVWRRQYPKRFDTQTSEEVSYEEWVAYDKKWQADGKPLPCRISRHPLKSNETTALINVAINMHERAIQAQQANRWWVPVFTGVLSFIGAALGIVAGMYF